MTDLRSDESLLFRLDQLGRPSSPPPARPPRTEAEDASLGELRALAHATLAAAAPRDEEPPATGDPYAALHPVLLGRGRGRQPPAWVWRVTWAAAVLIGLDVVLICLR